MKISFLVNGHAVTVEAPPLRRLLDVLREDLGLVGTKEGCGEGECGACAVRMDGRLVNACMVPIFQMAGRSVETIEGLASQGEPDALQQAFLEEGAVQCGFCTPGMVMASRALLEHTPAPSRDEIRTALAGNLCRCTGYDSIFRAVERAATAGYRVAPTPSNREPQVVPSSRESRAFLPTTLSEALAILHDIPDTVVVAGGTDLMPDLAKGTRPTPQTVLDLTRLRELRGIREEGGTVVIGAGEPFAALAQSALIRRSFPALAACAASVGAVAVQNRATIGGNLMTASAAADAPPVLLALDARVVLVSHQGSREIPMTALGAGYRRTVRRPDEVLAEIRIPEKAPGSRNAFYKLGPRRALVISRLTLACAARREDGRFRDLRIAVGSVAPEPTRLTALEAFLEGRSGDPEELLEAQRLAETLVQPRTAAAYRRTVAGNLVLRFLRSLKT